MHQRGFTVIHSAIALLVIWLALLHFPAGTIIGGAPSAAAAACCKQRRRWVPIVGATGVLPPVIAPPPAAEVLQTAGERCSADQ